MDLKPAHDLEVPSPSLRSCLDGPREAMLEPRAHGSVAPWSRFFASGMFGVPNPKIVWSLTLLLSPRIMDLKMLCFPLLPNFSEEELLEPLFLSATLSPISCPSPLLWIFSKSKHDGLLWRMALWLQLCPRWCQLIILPHIISAWAQVDVFVINEAFVLHHKTTEEYPSHSNELCHKVNYEMTFPGSKQRRPGVQASPDNCLPEILAEGNRLRGTCKGMSETQVWHSEPQISLPHVLCPGIRIQCPFPLCPFTSLSSLPTSGSMLKEKAYLLTDLDSNLCDLGHVT